MSLAFRMELLPYIRAGTFSLVVMGLLLAYTASTGREGVSLAGAVWLALPYLVGGVLALLRRNTFAFFLGLVLVFAVDLAVFLQVHDAVAGSGGAMIYVFLPGIDLVVVLPLGYRLGVIIGRRMDANKPDAA